MEFVRVCDNFLSKTDPLIRKLMRLNRCNKRKLSECFMYFGCVQQKYNELTGLKSHVNLRPAKSLAAVIGIPEAFCEKR